MGSRYSIAVSTLCLLLLGLSSGFSQDSALQSERIDVQIAPHDFDETTANTLVQIILDRSDVRSKIGESRHRVLSVDWGIIDLAATKNSIEGRYSLQLYDYEHDRLWEVNPNRIVELPLSDAPAPTPEEWDEAGKILAPFATDYEFLEAMPPLIHLPESRERVISVQLKPKRSHLDLKNEVVGVSLSRPRVIRFPGGAPVTSRAAPINCGFNSSGQGSTGRGLQGSATVTIKRGEEELWSFDVIRPSASSGALGSGVDLKAIKYKGKSFLSRLHIPIMNVQYDANVCGPYRDWQYAENAFKAVGVDHGPGIRKTTEKPTTILDTGSDVGNFYGVAVHSEPGVTTLVSELSAGWYRYVNEYKFYDDGKIEPRFKFGAVYNACVCKSHNHHVYWRMDFDIGGTGTTPNSGESFDGSAWQPVTREQKQSRETTKAWRIRNSQTGEGAEITPGPTDGTADTYGRGDIWWLRYHDLQVDDSQVRTGTAANIDAFLTGEALTDTDLVFWYGAHFRHTPEPTGSHEEDPHIVGPTIRAFR